VNPLPSPPGRCLSSAPNTAREQGSVAMAKGQKRSNKEAKKPKADKGKKGGAAASASPVAAATAKKPAGSGAASK
jgi:hypothetical protein